MANFVPDKTVDNAIDALGDYLALFTTAPIIRGFDNRTPMPKPPFIVLTEVLTKPLCKPIETYGDTVETMIDHNQIDVQVDFYGWDLSDTALAFMQTFRSLWATTNLASWIAPLYCSDIVKSPLTNAEEQYEQRWIVTVSMQYNAAVTLPQQTFNTKGETTAIPADVIFNVIT